MRSDPLVVGRKGEWKAATEKIGADRANTAEQVDHGRTDRQAKPARYVANLLNVGRSTLYRLLVA
jgi:hypothetical protein